MNQLLCLILRLSVILFLQHCHAQSFVFPGQHLVASGSLFSQLPCDKVRYPDEFEGITFDKAPKRGPAPAIRLNPFVTTIDGLIIVAGGLSAGGSPARRPLDIYSLCLQQWIVPVTSGVPPPFRDFPCVVQHGTDIVMYGGWQVHDDLLETFDDMYIFDVNSWSWSEVFPRGEERPPFSEVPQCFVSNKGLYYLPNSPDLAVIQTRSGSAFEQHLWEFDLTTHKWTNLIVDAASEWPIRWPYASAWGDTGGELVYVFGGLGILEFGSTAHRKESQRGRSARISERDPSSVNGDASTDSISKKVSQGAYRHPLSGIPLASTRIASEGDIFDSVPQEIDPMLAPSRFNDDTLPATETARHRSPFFERVRIMKRYLNDFDGKRDFESRNTSSSSEASFRAELAHLKASESEGGLSPIERAFHRMYAESSSAAIRPSEIAQRVGRQADWAQNWDPLTVVLDDELRAPLAMDLNTPLFQKAFVTRSRKAAPLYTGLSVPSGSPSGLGRSGVSDPGAPTFRVAVSSKEGFNDSQHIVVVEEFNSRDRSHLVDGSFTGNALTSSYRKHSDFTWTQKEFLAASRDSQKQANVIIAERRLRMSSDEKVYPRVADSPGKRWRELRQVATLRAKTAAKYVLRSAPIPNHVLDLSRPFMAISARTPPVALSRSIAGRRAQSFDAVQKTADVPLPSARVATHPVSNVHAQSLGRVSSLDAADRQNVPCFFSDINLYGPLVASFDVRDLCINLLGTQTVFGALADGSSCHFPVIPGMHINPFAITCCDGYFVQGSSCYGSPFTHLLVQSGSSVSAPTLRPTVMVSDTSCIGPLAIVGYHIHAPCGVRDIVPHGFNCSVECAVYRGFSGLPVGYVACSNGSFEFSLSGCLAMHTLPVNPGYLDRVNNTVTDDTSEGASATTHAPRSRNILDLFLVLSDFFYGTSHSSPVYHKLHHSQPFHSGENQNKSAISHGYRNASTQGAACRRAFFPPQEYSVSGTCASTYAPDGTVCTISCRSPYTGSVSGTATCSGGTYVHTLSGCGYSTTAGECPTYVAPPGYIVSGACAASSVAKGSICSFSCSSGWTGTPVSAVQCGYGSYTGGSPGNCVQNCVGITTDGSYGALTGYVVGVGAGECNNPTAVVSGTQCTAVCDVGAGYTECLSGVPPYSGPVCEDGIYTGSSFAGCCNRCSSAYALPTTGDYTTRFALKGTVGCSSPPIWHSTDCLPDLKCSAGYSAPSGIVGPIYCYDGGYVGAPSGCYQNCPAFSQTGYTSSDCNSIQPHGKVCAAAATTCNTATHTGTPVGSVLCQDGSYVGSFFGCLAKCPPLVRFGYTTTCASGADDGVVCMATCDSTTHSGSVTGSIQCSAGNYVGSFSGCFLKCSPLVQLGYTSTNCGSLTNHGTTCTASCAAGYTVAGVITGGPRCSNGGYTTNPFAGCHKQCGAYTQSRYLVSSCSNPTDHNTVCIAICDYLNNYSGVVSGGPRCVDGSYTSTPFTGCKASCPTYSQAPRYQVQICGTISPYHGVQCTAICSTGYSGTVSGGPRCDDGTLTSTLFTGCYQHCNYAYSQTGYAVKSQCLAGAVHGTACLASCDLNSWSTGVVTGSVVCSDGTWVGSFSGCRTFSETPTPSRSPTASPTVTLTHSPSFTNSPSATLTASSTASASRSRSSSPTVTLTSSPTTTLTLTSSFTATAACWKACMWTRILPDQLCELDSLNGFIHAGPTGYPGDNTPTVCQYQVIPSNSLCQVIQITIHWMNIYKNPSSISCDDAYLVFYDGADDRSPILLAKFCGKQTTPVVLTTKGRGFYVRLFQKAGLASFPGYYITWECKLGAVASCSLPANLSVNLNTGSLTDSTVANYLPNSACNFYLQGDSTCLGYDIIFTDLALEYTANCTGDYLAVYDGLTEDDTLLGKFCGRAAPPALSTSTNRALVKFVSDASRQDRGYIVSFSCRCNGCVQTCLHNQTSFGTIAVVDGYPESSTCKWFVSITVGQCDSIGFTLNHLNLSTGDQLRIANNKGVTMATYTGADIALYNPKISISGASAFIFLVPDGSLPTADGFELDYVCQCADCPINCLFTATPGSTQLLEYLNYDNSALCKWIISAPQCFQLIISFEFVDIELQPGDCDYDSLTIFDGQDDNAPLLAKVCGNQLPSPIITSSNAALVQFSSDTTVTAPGFRLSYSCPCGCSLVGCVLTSSRNIITDGPGSYGDGSNCTWLVTPSDAQCRLIAIEIVAIEFEDLIDSKGACSADYLRIYDGTDRNAPLLVDLCGASKPHYLIMTTGNAFFVNMVSDGSRTFEGFTLRYNCLDQPTCADACLANCVMQVSDSNGTISDGPSDYPLDRFCSWTVSTSAAHCEYIEIEFLSFDMESGFVCEYDRLKIYDGTSSSAPALTGTFGLCASPRIYQTSGNAFYITLESDGDVVGSGFELAWNCRTRPVCSLACPSACVYTTLTGSIASIGYPPSSGCSWSVSAPSTTACSAILITFDTLPDIGQGDCLLVQYRNGVARWVALLEVCSGSVLEDIPVVYVPSNNFRVTLSSDALQQGSGFSLQYKCLGDELCGNLADDNGDGLIDCADPMCVEDPFCVIVPPTISETAAGNPSLWSMPDASQFQSGLFYWVKGTQKLVQLAGVNEGPSARAYGSLVPLWYGIFVVGGMSPDCATPVSLEVGADNSEAWGHCNDVWYLSFASMKWRRIKGFYHFKPEETQGLTSVKTSDYIPFSKRGIGRIFVYWQTINVRYASWNSSVYLFHLNSFFSASLNDVWNAGRQYSATRLPTDTPLPTLTETLRPTDNQYKPTPKPKVKLREGEVDEVDEIEVDDFFLDNPSLHSSNHRIGRKLAQFLGNVTETPFPTLTVETDYVGAKFLTSRMSPTLSKSELPSVRSHGLAQLGDILFVHGGITFSDTAQLTSFSSSLYSFNISRYESFEEWETDDISFLLVPVFGASPSGRAFHSFHAINGLLILFGGHSDIYYRDSRVETYYNDVWLFDTQGSAWISIPETEVWPAPRCEFGSAVDDDRHLFVYGGRDESFHLGAESLKTNLRDYLWRFDVLLRTWTKLTLPANMTATKQLVGPVMEAVYFKNSWHVVILGGLSGTYPSDCGLWICSDVSSTAINCRRHVDPDSSLLSIYQVTSTVTGPRIWIFGGGSSGNRLLMWDIRNETLLTTIGRQKSTITLTPGLPSSYAEGLELSSLPEDFPDSARLGAPHMVLYRRYLIIFGGIVWQGGSKFSGKKRMSSQLFFLVVSHCDSVTVLSDLSGEHGQVGDICMGCSPGTTLNPTTKSCDNCAFGSYGYNALSSDGMFHQKCGVAARASNASSLRTLHSTERQTSIGVCPPGFFGAFTSAASFGTCIPCPSGTFQSSSASVSCQSCAVASNCPPSSTSSIASDAVSAQAIIPYESDSEVDSFRDIQEIMVYVFIVFFILWFVVFVVFLCSFRLRQFMVRLDLYGRDFQSYLGGWFTVVLVFVFICLALIQIWPLLVTEEVQDSALRPSLTNRDSLTSVMTLKFVVQDFPGSCSTIRCFVQDSYCSDLFNSISGANTTAPADVVVCSSNLKFSSVSCGVGSSVSSTSSRSFCTVDVQYVDFEMPVVLAGASAASNTYVVFTSVLASSTYMSASVISSSGWPSQNSGFVASISPPSGSLLRGLAPSTFTTGTTGVSYSSVRNDTSSTGYYLQYAGSVVGSSVIPTQYYTSSFLGINVVYLPSNQYYEIGISPVLSAGLAILLLFPLWEAVSGPLTWMVVALDYLFMLAYYRYAKRRNRLGYPGAPGREDVYWDQYFPWLRRLKRWPFFKNRTGLYGPADLPKRDLRFNPLGVEDVEECIPRAVPRRSPFRAIGDGVMTFVGTILHRRSLNDAGLYERPDAFADEFNQNPSRKQMRELARHEKIRARRPSFIAMNPSPAMPINELGSGNMPNARLHRSRGAESLVSDHSSATSLVPTEPSVAVRPPVSVPWDPRAQALADTGFSLAGHYASYGNEPVLSAPDADYQSPHELVPMAVRPLDPFLVTNVIRILQHYGIRGNLYDQDRELENLTSSDEGPQGVQKRMMNRFHPAYTPHLRHRRVLWRDRTKESFFIQLLLLILSTAFMILLIYFYLTSRIFD